MEKPKLFIVLVNYNSSSDTIECVQSLLKSNYERLQIFIVDNSETDSSKNEFKEYSDGQLIPIKSEFPQYVSPFSDVNALFIESDQLMVSQNFNKKVIYVKSAENRGFAAANNEVLRFLLITADADDLIWILNNDTVIANDIASQIVQMISTDPGKHNTLFGTPLMEYSAVDTVQAIGGKYQYITGLASHVGEGLKKPLSVKAFDLACRKVDYPIGASIILTKRFLDRIGLMEESYFLFFEELDWVARLKVISGQLKILPIFGVYHKQGSTTKVSKNARKSDFIDLVFLRSRLLFAERFNKRYLWSVKISVIAITIVRRLFQFRIKTAGKMLKLLFSKDYVLRSQ